MNRFARAMFAICIDNICGLWTSVPLAQRPPRLSCVGDHRITIDRCRSPWGLFGGRPGKPGRRHGNLPYGSPFIQACRRGGTTVRRQGKGGFAWVCSEALGLELRPRDRS